MTKVAILGATSHIAKGLIFNYVQRPDRQLYLFARSVDRVSAFLKEISAPFGVFVAGIDQFGQNQYDVVINCIGFGNPAMLVKQPTAISSLTKQYDELIISYLERTPGALYINFSSGAVYEPFESYGIAKLHSEIRHRELANQNIVDLRVFGYFSRFIDLAAKYLLSEIIACLLKGEEFLTDQIDVSRDYAHPEDLCALIDKCIERQVLNEAIDVYSLKPVKKSEILDYFKEYYGLKVRQQERLSIVAPTGRKENYYSINKKAGELLGYLPMYSSLDCIKKETKQIFA